MAGPQRAHLATCLVAGKDIGTKRTEAWLSAPRTGKQVFFLQADCVALDKLPNLAEPQLSGHQKEGGYMGIAAWL